MSARPGVFTRGLSGLSQSIDPDSPNVSSPAEQRDDAKRNFLKAMRPLPTQHYWNVYFDRYGAALDIPSRSSASRHHGAVSALSALAGVFPS